MGLPETLVVRRKDILEHLGISRRRFYQLIEMGHLTPRFLGDGSGKPLYLRNEVLRVEETLRKEIGER